MATEAQPRDEPVLAADEQADAVERKRTWLLFPCQAAGRHPALDCGLR